MNLVSQSRQKSPSFPFHEAEIEKKNFFLTFQCSLISHPFHTHFFPSLYVSRAYINFNV